MPERLGRVLMPKVSERRQREEVIKKLGVVPVRHMDMLLPGITLFLVGYGILIIYSATHSYPNPSLFVIKQVVAFIIGLILSIGIVCFDYRRLKVASPFIYGFIIISLLLVLFMGEVGGSSRWISLWIVNYQPSEYAKLVMVLVLANVLSENKSEPDSFRSFVIPVLWTIPVLLLIFIQPDLGTALVLVAVLLSLLYLAGVRMRYWLGLIGAGIVAFTLGIWFNIFKEYQVNRLFAFFHQGNDTSTSGYQLVQSKIAVGSGQLLGKGLTHGTQTNLNFTPEHHTDFIFSVVGEELGLIGAIILIAGFCFLLWRCLMVANNSRDLYGTYIAMGVITMFAFQMVVNIGMAIGIMPITGIPLPFISVGGSNLIVSLMAIALLVNVNMHRFAQL